MVKVTRTMTINSEVAEEFQRLFPNEASSFCNEQMRLRVASAKGDLTAVDVEILKVQEAEAQMKFNKANSELLQIKEQLRAIHEKSRENEKSRLQKEKAKLDAMSRCDGCGKQMVKPHLVEGKEQFCKECFFNEHPKISEAIKRNKP